MGKMKCIVKGCQNHTDLLRTWKKEICPKHKRQHIICPCEPPQGYRMFYAQSKSREIQQIWKSNLNLDICSWTKNTVVCSAHFVNGCPTADNPNPLLDVTTAKPKRHSYPGTENAPPAKKPCASNLEEGDTEKKLLDKIAKLEQQLEQHAKQIKKLRIEKRNSTFCSNNLMKHAANFKFYTGLTPDLFKVLFSNILPYTEDLTYWRGSQNTAAATNKRSRAHGIGEKLNKQDQFFLWLVKCRLNLKTRDLAYRFGISSSTVSNIFTTWTKFLRPILENFIIWPTKDTVKSNLPEKFKDFPETRVIIDWFELGIQHPKSLSAQAETYSNYKSKNAMKYLIGITPNVACSFISKGFGGRTSDKKITYESGFLEKLEPGDDCMADRGIDIEDLLRKHGATLNMPPMTKGKKQLSENEVTKTRRIASARIYVENFIGRVRTFRILNETIPINFARQIDDIVVCLCALCNIT
eukprot:Seg809.7 transcript_id=Seg809.7/GoldUCD/mRNA.D3Y31 product="hypothetical protein" protein_id=Seg809.7/GoldUCD/D3Y31